MKSAFIHVLLPLCFCLALANTSLFDSVLVDMNYDHYAEKNLESLPCYLAMPFNSLINLGYLYIGIYWLLQRTDSKGDPEAGYVKDVFALMVIAYGPVQWVRLATLRRAPSVLDQWVTLPIFAWVPVWCQFIENGWRPRYTFAVELCAILSYGLSLLHDQGFEVALGIQVTFAVIKGFGVHRKYGDFRSQRYLVLALLSCSGFVVLKVLDHTLAKYRLFQHLTGHFWSKVCDILQFHYSFCFFTHLTNSGLKRTE
ncbi:transmembrane protein 187 precursor [Esox lucius]|uniref:Transmembrane protein 187 n=1 Tax=Esox lucius TaxID=8010 RepID=C1BZB6_ESOLU|nr:transmembrane protein 187 precursor [Esox lucius]ACO14369.1 Transmembrane protein 187 [Esox lucius]